MGETRKKLIEKRSDYFVVPLMILWLIAPFILVLVGRVWGAVAYSVCPAPIMLMMLHLQKEKSDTPTGGDDA